MTRSSRPKRGKLQQHRQAPQDPDRHVQPMHADQHEEGGQEAAAVGGGAVADHGGEVVRLHAEEDDPKHQRHDQPEHQATAADDRASSPAMPCRR